MELKVKTPGSAAWMNISGAADPTHQELIKHLEKVVMTANGEGRKGHRGDIDDWHRRLGHPSFRR